VDYHHIQITDAMGKLAMTDILPRCFNSDGVSNPGYALNNAHCQRITRDPLTGNIASGQQGLFNLATYAVASVDTQFDWHFDLGRSAGRMEVNTIASDLKDYTVTGLLGSPTLDYAGSVGYDGIGADISHPKWKVGLPRDQATLSIDAGVQTILDCGHNACLS
jgi:hypothetical protein